jgi:5-methylcytosine-specific restriction endonuclease McrA
MSTTYLIDEIALSEYRSFVLPFISSRVGSLERERRHYSKGNDKFSVGYRSALDYAISSIYDIMNVCSAKNAEDNLSWSKKRKFRVYRFTNDSQKKHFSWRAQVLIRDKNTCRRCGGHHCLEAHHIYSVKSVPELAFDVNNGVTLCEDCHKLYHRTFGRVTDAEPLFKFLFREVDV